MVKVRENWINRKYGRLTVINQAEDYVSPKNKHFPRWFCKCECGSYIVAGGYDLKSGKIKSCGCLKLETSSRNGKGNKRYNKCQFTNECVVMYTTGGEPFFVDKEDYERIKSTCWVVNNKGYLSGIRDGKSVLLHRVITDCPNGMVVDHINHDKMDNRKLNLRIVTQHQNSLNHDVRCDNKSGNTGVNYVEASGKWLSRITIDSEIINLGTFDSYEDAVKIRKIAEDKYFGEFSYDNSQKVFYNGEGASKWR